jgi:integrase
MRCDEVHEVPSGPEGLVALKSNAMEGGPGAAGDRRSPLRGGREMTKQAAAGMTMPQFREAIMEHLRTRGTQAHSLSKYRRMFSIMETDMGVASVAELEQDEIIGRIAAGIKSGMPGVGPGTVRVETARFYATLRTGRKLGLLRRLPEIPVLGLGNRKARSDRTRPPAQAEVRRLMEYLESDLESWEGRRLHALVSSIMLTGLSIVDIIKLPVSSIDLVGGIIWTRPRGKSSLATRMPTELKVILLAWLRLAGSEWAFPNLVKRGRPWQHEGRGCRTDPSLTLYRACEAAGVGRITYEQLRRFHSESSVAKLALDAQMAPAGNSPSVNLGAPTDPAIFRGEDVGVLSQAEYRVVSHLLDLFPGGLTKRQMDQKFKGTWRTTLRRLKAKREAINASIGFPEIGFPGKENNQLYRIMQM